MEAYNILNTVKPNFLVSKYPYSLVNPAKIILTKKKISIIVKQLKQSSKNEVKGGSDNPIVFYG